MLFDKILKYTKYSENAAVWWMDQNHLLSIYLIPPKFLQNYPKCICIAYVFTKQPIKNIKYYK